MSLIYSRQKHKSLYATVTINILALNLWIPIYKKIWKLGSAYRRLLCVPYIDELCGCASKQKMQKYKRFLSLKLLISEQGIDYLTF